MQKQTICGFGKWWCVLLCLILTAGVMGSRVYAQEEKTWTGNINLFVGQKWLDEGDWEPLEEQFELGIQYDFRPVEWPVNLTVDVLYSWDDGKLYDPWLGFIDLEARTLEIAPGVRKIWEQHPFIRPFIGGGPAFIWVEGEGSAWGVTVSEDDWGLGVWVGGGVYVTLIEWLNLGLQARYSWAEVDLVGVDVEAGGWHLGALVGVHW